MNATDARRHSPAQLEILRERGLALRAEGRSAIEIGKVLGVGRGTIYKWLKKEKETSTEQAIKGGKRGRPPGACKVLSAAQEVEIQKLITEKNPLQLKFDSALWTRRAIRALIKRLYGVEMPMTTVGCYLRSWGMTPQRPSRRAIERNNEKVQLRLNEQYPAIAKRAKAEGAVIYWSDETAVKHDCNWETGCAPAGKTPIHSCHDGRWQTATMVSAISNQGLLRFKIQNVPMNQDTFIEFLENLIRDGEKKIFLVVDNLRVHKSRRVTAWAKEHKYRIELFFLPPYCPELNPDEYVNRAVKTEIRSHASAKMEALTERVETFMRKMSRRAKWIAKIFDNEAVRYTASC